MDLPPFFLRKDLDLMLFKSFMAAFSARDKGMRYVIVVPRASVSRDNEMVGWWCGCRM